VEIGWLLNAEPARSLHNRILVMNADGSRRSILFRDPERSALAWSPPGGQIAIGIGAFSRRSSPTVVA
jgi:hypothetical protein